MVEKPGHDPIPVHINHKFQINRDGVDDQPRYVVVQTLDQFINFVADYIHTRLTWHFEREYQVSAAGITQLELEFGPGHALLAEWHRQQAVQGAGYIPTPPHLEVKYCVVNIVNKKGEPTGERDGQGNPLLCKETDPRCAAFCILAAHRRRLLGAGSNLHRINNYRETQRRYQGQKYLDLKPNPFRWDAFGDWSQEYATIDQLKKFEEDNQHYMDGQGVAIYVYTYKENKVPVLVHASRRREGYSIILLHLQHNPNAFTREKFTGHFVLVTCFNALMGLRGELGGNHLGHNTRWCHRCLGTFSTETRLKNHLQNYDCLDVPQYEEEEHPQQTRHRLPSANSNGDPVYAQFDNPSHHFLHPFPHYWDLETRKAANGRNLVVSGAFCTAHTENAVWKPLQEMGMFHGEDAHLHLLKDLVANLLHFVAPYDLALNHNYDKAAWEVEKQTKGCCVCGTFEKIVRDHDHLTGEIRRPMCSTCNSRVHRPLNILAIAHNSGKFDMMFMVQALAKWQREIDCPEYIRRASWSIIPRSTSNFNSMDLRIPWHREGEDPDGDQPINMDADTEAARPAPALSDEEPEEEEEPRRKKRRTRRKPYQKNISITFLDSYQYYGRSLETLIQNQRKYNPDITRCFPLTAKLHPWRDQLNLITQKIDFPYRALSLSNWEGILVKDLPRDMFHNDLRLQECSEEKYQEIQTLLAQIGITTFKEYHDCYLWNDVFLLADVMTLFRQLWFKRHGLDLYRSRALATASYNAMIKSIGPVFELITEANGGMELFELVKSNLMGGVSYAKEVHMKQIVDHIIAYIDACSLYPSCCTDPLPIGKYRKVEMTLAQVEQMIAEYDDDHREADGTRTACFIDCTFFCDPDYHDQVDYAPPCRMRVQEDMLTGLQRHTYKRAAGGKPPKFGGEKVVPFLGEQRGARHISLLKLWMDVCHVRIKTVHAVWMCEEKAVLREYFEELARLKANASNDAEREVIKLEMNAGIGYCGINMDKQTCIRVYTDPWKFYLQVVKGGHKVKDFKTLTREEDGYFLGIIQMEGDVREYLTPRLVALAVYDRSKYRMFRFHYYLRKAGWTLKFAYTDTDSLIYQIKIQQGLTFLKMMQAWNKKYGAAIGYFDCTGFLGFDERGKIIECRYKGALGSFKVEHGAPGDEILEVITLAAKMYALLTTHPTKGVILHAKGLPKWIIDRGGFEDYSRALLDNAPRKKHDIPSMKNIDLHSTQVTLSRSGVAWQNDKCVIWALTEQDGNERVTKYLTLPHGYVGKKGCRMAQMLQWVRRPLVKGLLRGKTDTSDDELCVQFYES
jgi:hypothetical protein